MSKRLNGLSEPEFKEIIRHLNEIEDRLSYIGNLIGPAWGAKWLDKEIDVNRKVGSLKLKIQDMFWDQKNA